MIDYVPLPRRCSDCGATDQTILVETALGDRLCRRCFTETTRDTGAHQPATPTLDRAVERGMRPR